MYKVILRRVRVTVVAVENNKYYMLWVYGCSVSYLCGPISVVGIATGWTVRGSNPCTMGTRSFPEVKSGWCVTLTPHPPLVPWSKRVELYLYSPYGPYCIRVPFTFFSYLAYKAHGPYIVISGLSGSTIFFVLFHTFWKKIIKHKICFDFLYKFCLKDFPFSEEFSKITLTYIFKCTHVFK